MRDEDPTPYLMSLRGGDAITATIWTEGVPDIEGDVVEVHAELNDVDEVALIVRDDDELVTIWMPRVQAIVLAGQIAACATKPASLLASGHGPQGPLA